MTIQTNRSPSYYQNVARIFFRNAAGDPFELTDGQAEIFKHVYEPSILRSAIRAVTQYGKSDTTAIAAITAAVTRREKILIVAPSTEQAKIIMGFIISHLFDHYYLTKMLDFPPGSLERLKQEKSKKRITLINGSEIFILTASAREVSKEAKGLMGFGASIVVVDESSLLPDVMFSKILRMVGGVEKGKLIQLGNPFEENHFARAFNSPRYRSIIIRWQQAVKEKRLTSAFISEAREEMTDMDFKIFYDCDFPKEGADNVVIPSHWVDMAIGKKVAGGDKRSGLDVARFGGDNNVYSLRDGGRHAKMVSAASMDTMEVVGWARNLIDGDDPEMTAVDVIGIGAGVYDRLNEEGYEVHGVNVAEKPVDTDKEDRDVARTRYANLKAQMAWHLRDFWFKPRDGKSNISIINDPELIEEIKQLRYGFDSMKRRKIESKEDMKKRIGRSPDKLDSVILAYSDLTDDNVEMYIE